MPIWLYRLSIHSGMPAAAPVGLYMISLKTTVAVEQPPRFEDAPAAAAGGGTRRPVGGGPTCPKGTR